MFFGSVGGSLLLGAMNMGRGASLNRMLGGGGGGGYHPLNHSGMSIYGPIANLPQHYRRAVYTGLPMGGHGMGISQRSIKEMQDRNLAPPGVQTHFGAKARSGPDALRALNVKKNLDPEYLPSGELRPPPEQATASTSTGAGAGIGAGVATAAPAAPAPSLLEEVEEIAASPLAPVVAQMAAQRGPQGEAWPLVPYTPPTTSAATGLTTPTPATAPTSLLAFTPIPFSSGLI